MAALDGAAWMAAHASTKEGFKTWLKDLADDAQIPVADFVGDLAVELKSSSLLSEAEYGKVPTSLQKGRLYNRLAEARVQIDDIPNGVEWKDKPADWWMEHGATVATRFLKIFSARGGGGGAMTDQMIKGKVLRKQECDVVVQHDDFMALSVALAAEDWVTAKALTDPNTGEFGKLVTVAV